ncbi:sulfur carrier protein ThiS [uncultured Paraglaciecola sp.]|uniref:sulfur carrier protein ThiS n=1 Tax=uncultured Paraglaciecola sp. TaxID=1765024 RepID=UPI0030DD220D
MFIKVNNNTIQIPPSCTLQILINQHYGPETDIAAAINDSVIPHSRWASTALNQDDHVTLFQAIAGG